MCREGIRFFSTLLIGVALNNSKMQPRIEMLDALGCYEGGWKDGEFHNPEGLASDSAGNLYVADETNHRVQKIDQYGKLIFKIGGVGLDGRPVGGTAPGEFLMHRAVCVDHHDNLYVGDSQNNRVQSFDSLGNFRFMFGSQGNGEGQFGGVSGPNGVAVDDDGFIYVTDTHTALGGNNRVQKFNSKGSFILQFGGHGLENGLFAGKVLSRSPYAGVIGGLNPEGPYGVAVGPKSGLLYIADTDNSRIQIFERDGKFVKSVAEGLIFGPRQICLDSQENIYVPGFHMAPDIVGLENARPTWADVRFLWVLNNDGELIFKIGNQDARGLFEHGGGQHHAVTLSKIDESILYFQAGHHIMKFKIHW